MSRTRRFLHGLSTTYLLFIVTSIAGLWLTRFLLARVDQAEYGQWLVLIQLLGYLEMTDLGVVAVLPREVAYATGNAPAQDRLAAARGVIEKAWGVVLWQLPLAATAALAFWWLAGRGSGDLARPAALVVLVYVALFPLRMYPAALQGLQELGYLGWVNLAAWLLSFVITVSLVGAGYGAWGLALAWVAFRTAYTGACWLRFRLATMGQPVLPPAVTARSLVASGLWVSVSQLATGLLTGAELIVLGQVSGPDAVVVYACTAKLTQIFGTQVYGVVLAADSAVSELRKSAPREQVASVSQALGLLLLLVSGLVACVVLATNAGFVTWWVGETRYGGLAVTALLVSAMVVRHFMFVLMHLLYCCGYERTLALVNLTDGVVFVAGTAGLVAWLGLPGVPLGSLIAVVAVSLPTYAVVLSRELGVSPASLLFRYFPWLWRFLMLAMGVAATTLRYPPQGVLELALAAIMTCAIYAAVMVPVLLRSPLWPYVQPRLAPIWERLKRRATS